MAKMTKELLRELGRFADMLVEVQEGIRDNALPTKMLWTQIHNLCEAFHKAFPPVEVSIMEVKELLIVKLVTGRPFETVAEVVKNQAEGIAPSVVDAEAGKKDVTGDRLVLFVKGKEGERCMIKLLAGEKSAIMQMTVETFADATVQTILDGLIEVRVADVEKFNAALLKVGLLFDNEEKRDGFLRKYNPSFGE